MDLMQKINLAKAKYEFVTSVVPNTIYIAKDTYKQLESSVPSYIMAVRPVDGRDIKHTIFGMMIKISYTIEDGFQIVNEF